jgi:hypothetical protein
MQRGHVRTRLTFPQSRALTMLLNVIPEQQDDGFWKLCMCLDCIVFLFLAFVLICFYIFFVIL